MKKKKEIHRKFALGNEVADNVDINFGIGNGKYGKAHYIIFTDGSHCDLCGCSEVVQLSLFTFGSYCGNCIMRLKKEGNQDKINRYFKNWPGTKIPNEKN